MGETSETGLADVAARLTIVSNRTPPSGLLMCPPDALRRQQFSTNAVHGPALAYVCVTCASPLTTSFVTSTAVTVIVDPATAPSPKLSVSGENVSPTDAEHGLEKNA